MCLKQSNTCLYMVGADVCSLVFWVMFEAQHDHLLWAGSGDRKFHDVSACPNVPIDSNYGHLGHLRTPHMQTVPTRPPVGLMQADNVTPSHSTKGWRIPWLSWFWSTVRCSSNYLITPSLQMWCKFSRVSLELPAPCKMNYSGSHCCWPACVLQRMQHVL